MKLTAKERLNLKRAALRSDVDRMRTTPEWKKLREDNPGITSFSLRVQPLTRGDKPLPRFKKCQYPLWPDGKPDPDHICGAPVHRNSLCRAHYHRCYYIAEGLTSFRRAKKQNIHTPGRGGI